MLNTIGEIVNIILPYSNNVSIRTMNGMPFIKASIIDSNKFTKYWVYVIQTDTNIYSTCESHDDVFDRYFPSGNLNKPFITEIDIIRDMFELNHDNDISYKYEKITTGLNTKEFLIHFIRRLNKNKIIRFNPKDFDTRLTALGFTSARILKTLERGFEIRNRKHGTILDLLYILIVDNLDFSLGKLKDKETRVIEIKLRELGVRICIDKNSNLISSIQLEKMKG